MNVIVKLGGVVTLPAEVIEELDLEPGSEISFNRSPEGTFSVQKADPEQPPSREKIRDEIRVAALVARRGLDPIAANMTTDEYMEFIRG